MRKFLFLIFSSFFVCSSIISQNISFLKIGEKVPALFLNNSETTSHSFNFLKQQKLVYVHFWDVDADTSKSQLDEVRKLYNEFSAENYISNKAFDVITVATGKDLKKWQSILKYYKLNNELSYISTDGYCDLYLKTCKIDKPKYGLLVDETGSVVLINPTILQVKNYLNKFSADNTNNIISGRVMTGTKNLSPLSYRKIYITNKNDDTIQVIITNNMGDFTIKNEYPKNELSIKISKYPEIKGTDKVFMADKTGKVVGIFAPGINGFTYKLLAKDVFILKQMEDVEDPEITSLNYKKKIFYTERVFHSNETNLSDSAKKRLDIIIQKLKESPSLKVEIKSHTDVTGSPDGNLVLSTTRAKKIFDYFISKGIDKKRMNSVGFGDKFPIVICDDGNCTPTEIELNRRTDFILWKN